MSSSIENSVFQSTNVEFYVKNFNFHIRVYAIECKSNCGIRIIDINRIFIPYVYYA